MPNQTTSPVLVEVTRGPEVESRHRGQIVVADATGKLHHRWATRKSWSACAPWPSPFRPWRS